MGKVSGDKSRYNRQRRKQIAQREQMRALRVTLGAKAAVTPQPKAAVTPQPKAGAKGAATPPPKTAAAT